MLTDDGCILNLLCTERTLLHAFWSLSLKPPSQLEELVGSRPALFDHRPLPLLARRQYLFAVAAYLRGDQLTVHGEAKFVTEFVGVQLEDSFLRLQERRENYRLWTATNGRRRAEGRGVSAISPQDSRAVASAVAPCR